MSIGQLDRVHSMFVEIGGTGVENRTSIDWLIAASTQTAGGWIVRRSWSVTISSDVAPQQFNTLMRYVKNGLTRHPAKDAEFAAWIGAG